MKKIIETQRLIIKPLSLSELRNYLMNPNKLSEDLGLQPLASQMDKEVSEAILNDLLPNLSNPNRNPLFYTMWIMIEKLEKVIVGSFCFHGEPDENGEIEIGYGAEEDYRSKGYMTEAVAGVIRWAENIESIKTIKAETEETNKPSIKVLENNGFKPVMSNENSLILKLNIKDCL